MSTRDFGDFEVLHFQTSQDQTHFSSTAEANLAATSNEQKLLMMKGTGQELLQSMKTHLCRDVNSLGVG